MGTAERIFRKNIGKRYAVCADSLVAENDELKLFDLYFWTMCRNVLHSYLQ